MTHFEMLEFNRSMLFVSVYMIESGDKVILVGFGLHMSNVLTFDAWLFDWGMLDEFLDVGPVQFFVWKVFVDGIVYVVAYWG